MRIFLDEDVPRELSADFRAGGHEVVHVEDVGMKGAKNGALLSYISGKFDVLVTADTNLGFQQHLPNHAVAVVLLHPALKTVQQLRALIPAALAVIPSAPIHRVTPVLPSNAQPPKNIA
jgi:predicted nuclease of predicted toxin-antitoxin system